MGYGVGIVLNADYSKCYKNIGVQVIVTHEATVFALFFMGWNLFNELYKVMLELLYIF